MIIWPKFDMEQYREDDIDYEDELQLMYYSIHNWSSSGHNNLFFGSGDVNSDFIYFDQLLNGYYCELFPLKIKKNEFVLN